MRKRLVTTVAGTALAGSLGLAGAVLLPAAAQADPGSGVGGRLSALTDALKGLVTDGTLTQAQADKVASTLQATPPQRAAGDQRAAGPGGREAGAQEIADLLGLTPAQLRTELQSGKTLAQVAAAHGVAKQALIDSLVAAGQQRLTEAVAAGRLTQAQADARKAGLAAEVADRVDRTGPPRGGRGHHGGGHGPASKHGDGPGPDTDAATTPSPQQSPTSVQTPSQATVANA